MLIAKSCFFLAKDYFGTVRPFEIKRGGDIENKPIWPVTSRVNQMQPGSSGFNRDETEVVEKKSANVEPAAIYFSDRALKPGYYYCSVEQVEGKKYYTANVIEKDKDSKDAYVNTKTSNSKPGYYQVSVTMMLRMTPKYGKTHYMEGDNSIQMVDLETDTKNIVQKENEYRRKYGIAPTTEQKVAVDLKTYIYKDEESGEALIEKIIKESKR